MWDELWNEVRARHSSLPPQVREVTVEADFAELPPAARACMKFFDVGVSTPKDWSFCLGWKGRFRLGPDKPWMTVEAVQFDARAPVARFFHMKARMMGVLPVLARDTYVDGKGRMLARVAGLFTVADGKGPAFDTGELVTWLNDAVFFAPTMLLGPSTRWAHVDDSTFDLALTDRGRTVTARVSVDAQGAPVNFETSDRYLNDPSTPQHALVRGRWSTPIDSWRRVGRRVFPARGKAVWRLPAGDFPYVELESIAETVAFDPVPFVGAHTSGGSPSAAP
jgi:hypothetical protein